MHAAGAQKSHSPHLVFPSSESPKCRTSVELSLFDRLLRQGREDAIKNCEVRTSLWTVTFSEHCSRRFIHFNVTEHPTADWTLQQLREALPGDQDYEFLSHDRHKTFSSGLDEDVERCCLQVLRRPVRMPTANAHCERLIGTIRRECLDYVIPFNAAQVRRTR